MTDILERDIYALICGSDGIKAREIARRLHADRGCGEPVSVWFALHS